MVPPAYFGIESSGLNVAVDLLILFVVVLYFALVYWTYADARRRIADPMLIGCAVVASLFPFVGTIIYMILRPPEYLEDVRERELELQAAEARLHQLEQLQCAHCDYPVERDFVRCPSCLRRLKERCTSCSRPLDRSWTICPYCEADVPGLSGSRTRRRRPAAVDSGFSAVSEPEEEALPGPLTAAAEEQLAEEAAPLAASESPTRPRRAGRSTRPSGRPRPSA
jgi:Double zinc ribbon